MQDYIINSTTLNPLNPKQVLNKFPEKGLDSFTSASSDEAIARRELCLRWLLQRSRLQPRLHRHFRGKGPFRKNSGYNGLGFRVLGIEYILGCRATSGVYEEVSEIRFLWLPAVRRIRGRADRKWQALVLESTTFNRDCPSCVQSRNLGA